MRTRGIKELSLAASLLMTLMFILTACEGSSPAVPPHKAVAIQTIKIGSLHPLTGALADDGKQMDAAIKLAVDDINAAGGIKSMGGVKLAVDSADTQGKADVAQNAAQRLIDDKVVALIGTYQSAATVNVARTAERAQVPLVIDVTAADDILTQGYTYSFRIQPNATTMGTYGAHYLKNIAEISGTPVKTVAYIHEQSEFGTSVFKAFKAEATLQGIQIVKEMSYDALNVSNLTPALTQIKQAKPDVLVATGFYKDSLLLAQNAAAVTPGVKAVFGVANGAFDLPQFPRDAGKNATYYFSSNYCFDAASPDATKMREAFKAKTGEDIRTPAVFSYQAVQVIADALERARSADPKALRDAIAKTVLDSTLFPFPGPITFDKQGENKNAQPILMQVQNGEVVQVYPDKYAQTKPVYPATPWSGGSK